jgi:hypothetical protein
MNFQIGTTKISSNEALDHALIQCLRLFAQHGRKLRNQEMHTVEYLSDHVIVREESRDLRDKENNQIELIYS